jgi:hypothetical protein
VPARSNVWLNVGPLAGRRPANPPSALSGTPLVTVCSIASRLTQTTCVPTGTSSTAPVNWKVRISTVAGSAVVKAPATTASTTRIARIASSEGSVCSADWSTPAASGRIGEAGARA